MKKLIATTILIISGVFYSFADNRRIGTDTPSESLVAKINQVTVMELTSDQPIVYYRLRIDGNPENKRQVSGDQANHLFLAAVPEGVGTTIHMRIGNRNAMLSAPDFKMWPDNNMQLTIQYTYPMKRVNIENWITIYSVAIVQHDETTVRKLEVQIKGAN